MILMGKKSIIPKKPKPNRSNKSNRLKRPKLIAFMSLKENLVSSVVLVGRNVTIMNL
jgi:hypothetical protein